MLRKAPAKSRVREHYPLKKRRTLHTEEPEPTKVAPMTAFAKSRFNEVINLKLGGCSDAFIAESLEINVSDVKSMVNKYLKELSKENEDKVLEYRELELLRLDQLLMTHWVRRSDPKIAHVILDIIDKRCKLRGVNAPEIVINKSVGKKDEYDELSDADLDRIIMQRLGGVVEQEEETK